MGGVQIPCTLLATFQCHNYSFYWTREEVTEKKKGGVGSIS